MSQTAIEFQNVTKQFDNAALPSVDQVSLTIEEGEFITILGSSGSGKTTLLKMVNRLYEPTGGKIFLFGEDISTVDVVKVRRRSSGWMSSLTWWDSFRRSSKTGIHPNCPAASSSVWGWPGRWR